MAIRSVKRPAKPSPAQKKRQQAAIDIFRTADALRRSFETILAPYDLTVQQYNVLRILRGAREPLPTMEIANRMIEKTPGITGLLDRLEDKQLVSRARGSDDRRCSYGSISSKGLELLAQLDATVDAEDQRVLSMLSNAEVEQLATLLEAIRAPYH